MARKRNLSVLLLILSSLLGLFRGLRMITYGGEKPILFPYREEMLKVSVFSNYTILGWIVFVLIGLFSVLAIVSIAYKFRNYGYLIIVESIFISFLTLTHIMMTELVWVHLPILALSLLMLVLGILQTPREF